MNLIYSIIMMFCGSFIVQYFFMSSIMVYKNIHIQNSIGKVYLSIIMSLFMVLIEIIMHDIYHKNIHYIYYFVNLLLLILFIYIYKNQIYINDKNYLQEMIEHHSMALLTSNKIINKTKNNKIKNIANNIINTQNKEINQMNDILNN